LISAAIYWADASVSRFERSCAQAHWVGSNRTFWVAPL